MLTLEITKRTDPRLLASMEVHYSQPKGFVGRNICYAILFDGVYYGHIVGGSATLHLPNRNEFFGIDGSTQRVAKGDATHTSLNNFINNIYYHIEPVNGKYPTRNFTQKVIKAWRETILNDWETKYGDKVLGFETLVELPRTGECYVRDGWEELGVTKGFTCKRVAGQSTDSWTGKRTWDYVNLRPKRVFAHRV